jgi:hypothetical protein
MSDCITAVVENGLLRHGLATQQPKDADKLAAVRGKAAKYSPGWWDEFERDLRANRLNFEERF